MSVEPDSPLRIESLFKKYGDLIAVNNVSFEMKLGEIFGLLGANGAGKTSIISCIVTLEEPTQGRCQVFGMDPVEDPLKNKNAHWICAPGDHPSWLFYGGRDSYVSLWLFSDLVQS